LSAVVSPATGRPYGIERTCRSLGLPRSSFYAWRQHELAAASPRVPGKRGPKPLLSDEGLLEAIRAEMAASPFMRQGHRKVLAKLRKRHGVSICRKRVLRIMRQHQMLSRPSPQRTNPVQEGKHDDR
jgi:putative transposase